MLHDGVLMFAVNLGQDCLQYNWILAANINEATRQCYSKMFTFAENQLIHQSTFV